MHRILISLALLGVSTLAASAVQAQSSVPLAGNGVSTEHHELHGHAAGCPRSQGHHLDADPIGRGSLRQGEDPRRRLLGRQHLERDSDGTWHARAYKGPADVLVAVDRSGHISEMRQNGQSSY